MSFGDFLFILSGPLMVFVAAIVVIYLTRWQDAREDRRRIEKTAKPHRS